MPSTVRAMDMDALAIMVGHLGTAPVLRRTKDGVAVTDFSLAVQRRRRLPDGSIDEGPVTWYRVTCWRQQAENVAASLGKGDRVVVVGTVVLRPWENTAKGTSGTSLEVDARNVAVSLEWATAKPVRSHSADASIAQLLDGEPTAKPKR